MNHVVADTHERLTRIATLFRRVLFVSALQIRSETEGEVPASRSPAYARNGEVDSVSGASLAPRRRPLGAHRADEYAAGVASTNSSAAMTKADEPILSNYVRSAPEQGGDHCSVGPAHPGRGVRRWSTASWWRRTKISISLVVSDRAQHDPAQELEEHLVGQPQRHRRITAGSR